MTVTVSSKYNKVFVIHIDDEPFREIHQTIFGRQPKFPNNLTTEKFLELEYQAAKRYAFWRLSKYNQPSTELKRALNERLVSAETVTQIIDQLISSGYLNDQEWVFSFVRRNLEKGRGPKDVEMKLRQKKIPFNLIEEALQQFDNPDQRKEKISKILNQKYHSRDLSNPKERQKVIAALIRRGFPLSEILESIY